MNADSSTYDDDDDDELLLGLELWEVITILVIIVFGAIGFCTTFTLVSSTASHSYRNVHYYIMVDDQGSM